MMNSSVEIERLVVRRGRATVIDGLDLRIPRGAIVGLLGPSGSGKTTLMRSIVGVQAVRSGTVTALGEPAGAASLRPRIGYMTQQASIYDDLTVRQNLRYFARVQGAPASEVDRVIERTDLTGQRDQLCRALSGGQAGRVSLAIAMLGGPELLVLDEPTVGLDPVLRAELWTLFRSLADDGATLLVSSHVMDEAARCDRLLLMRDGAIIEDTTPSDLLASTGARDAEEAFLRVIEAHAKSSDAAPPEAAASDHPRHGRHAGGAQ
ncbi:ABC-2 type transport system ATP-binding protein [Paramicrobacterium humi]|uniref:ABC-2 type transport system ATP-binding protein n=1 Tax=Paramicrobacterium humi TaxID=640635 RepID=A0A1H4JTX6_9MICO|nr:ABC transporter ATP-binding protein [Microbacterium humi]SEB49446.1 ABC-2 type transport system ATP-binding protein [Microbacterium humi]